jgi:hypothetical protein
MKRTENPRVGGSIPPLGTNKSATFALLPGSLSLFVTSQKIKEIQSA